MVANLLRILSRLVAHVGVWSDQSVAAIEITLKLRVAVAAHADVGVLHRIVVEEIGLELRVWVW